MSASAKGITLDTVESESRNLKNELHPDRPSSEKGGEIRGRSWSIFLLAALFTAAGILHFVTPGEYESMVPLPFPDHALLVKLSGLCEILGGIGLLVRRTRVIAAWSLIILLIAVFPANIEMLRQASAAAAPLLWRTTLWIRLPLQGVLIWWIGWATRLRFCQQPRR